MVATKNIQNSTTSFLQELVDYSGEIIVKGFNNAQFEKMTAQFPELRMEREKNGNITIMAPIAGFGGQRENKLSIYLGTWALKKKMGETFSPSTGFILPDGSTKSPDASWLSNENLKKVRAAYSGKGFLPVVPNFVIELRSKTDNLKKLKDKMEKTWVKNGIQLGWLIDPYHEKAYIYRSDESIEIVTGFENKLSGEAILPDFELDLNELRLTDGH